MKTNEQEEPGESPNVWYVSYIGVCRIAKKTSSFQNNIIMNKIYRENMNIGSSTEFDYPPLFIIRKFIFHTAF